MTDTQQKRCSVDLEALAKATPEVIEAELIRLAGEDEAFRIRLCRALKVAEAA